MHSLDPIHTAHVGVILVVDDDPEVRHIACAALQRYGYSVLTAENGQAAVDVFLRNTDKITAVLMDLTMPVMGGAQAFHLMNDIRPDIPIIISSGYGETEVRGQFTRALAGVMQKPYTASRLREKIAEVLTSKGALVEAARMGLSSKPAVRNASR
jgi:two-component system cell cycle sensor histidine kinase/response regulator CckA